MTTGKFGDEEFTTEFVEHFSGKRWSQLQTLCSSSGNEHFLNNASWTIVPKCCEYLTDNNADSDSVSIDVISSILNRISQIGNAKELVVLFCEALDRFKDDLCFRIVLSPLQIAVLRLESKRSYSVDTALEVIVAHLATMPDTSPISLETSERKIQAVANDELVRCSQLLKEIYDFSEPFISQCSSVPLYVCDAQNNLNRRKQPGKANQLSCDDKVRESNDDKHDNKDSMQRAIVKRLAALFYKPLCFLDFIMDEDLERAVLDIVMLMLKIMPDCYKLTNLIWSNLTSNSVDTDASSELAVSNLVYILVSSTVEAIYSSFPFVYRPCYKLDTFLPCSVMLLSHDDSDLLVSRGLETAEILLNNIEDGSLPVDTFERKHFTQAIRLIGNVMVFSKESLCRQQATRMYPLVLKKLRIEGRYRYFLYIFNNIDQPGLLGYSVYLLKEQIVAALNEPNGRSSQRAADQNTWFSGRNVWTLLTHVLQLKGGVKTDLVNDSDLIVSTLNLLRMLVIHSKGTQVLSEKNISWVVSHYFHDIRKGLDLSRAHYKEYMKSLKAGEVTDCEKRMDIVVGGQTLPTMSDEEKVAVIDSALSTLDLIESLLARLNELIDEGHAAAATTAAALTLPPPATATDNSACSAHHLKR